MQSKRQSMVESLSNVAIGYLLSFLASFVILPLFDYSTPTATQAFGITACYTIIAIIRNYGVRRAFNLILKRKLSDDNCSL